VGDNQEEVTAITDIVDAQQSTESPDCNQELANVQSPTIVVQEAEQKNTKESTSNDEIVMEPVDFISDLPTVQDEIQTIDPTLQPSGR